MSIKSIELKFSEIGIQKPINHEKPITSRWQF